jgi:hypothetical protein
LESLNEHGDAMFLDVEREFHRRLAGSRRLRRQEREAAFREALAWYRLALIAVREEWRAKVMRSFCKGAHVYMVLIQIRRKT